MDADYIRGWARIRIRMWSDLNFYFLYFCASVVVNVAIEMGQLCWGPYVLRLVGCRYYFTAQSNQIFVIKDSNRIFMSTVI